MIKYGLAKKLKDAGFPKLQGEWEEIDEDLIKGNWDFYGLQPSLSELIEACGNKFDSLERDGKNNWGAMGMKHENTCYWGNTPEEAVAHLWLEINEK